MPLSYYLSSVISSYFLDPTTLIKLSKLSPTFYRLTKDEKHWLRLLPLVNSYWEHIFPQEQRRLEYYSQRLALKFCLPAQIFFYLLHTNDPQGIYSGFADSDNEDDLWYVPDVHPFLAYILVPILSWLGL